MQASHRGEFDVLLEKLYGGFNMPISEARKAAYWDGLAKMSLGQFSAAVDAALGEEGPERIPSVSALWKISKTVRQRSAPLPPAQQVELDHLLWFANRLLINHLSSRGGLRSSGHFVSAHGMTNCQPSDELAACLKIKTALVETYLELIAEGNPLATPFAFVSDWVKLLRTVSEITPAGLEHYRKVVGREHAKDQFPLSMARKIA